MASLSRTSTNGTETDPDKAAQSNNLTAIISRSSSASLSKEVLRPLKISGRSVSHSLLAAAGDDDFPNRKAGRLQSAHSMTTMDKANISMPPPEAKPLSDRRLSFSLRSPRASEDNSTSTASPPSSLKGSEGVARTPMTVPTSAATIATNTASVTTSSFPQLPGLPVTSPPSLTPNEPPNLPDIVTQKSGHGVSNPPGFAAQGTPRNDAAGIDGPFPQRGLRTTAVRSSSRDPRRFSGSTANSTASETESMAKTTNLLNTF
jgi:hypothetical protein